MYRQGQALEDAHAWLTDEIQRQNNKHGSYDHNRIDFFGRAVACSDSRAILCKYRDYVIYKLWVAELFHHGREIGKQAYQLFTGAVTAKAGVWCGPRILHNHLNEITQLSHSISAFEHETLDCCSCLLNTSIYDSGTWVVGLSHLLYSVRQQEQRAYEVVMTRLSEVYNARLGWAALAVSFLMLVMPILIARLQ